MSRVFPALTLFFVTACGSRATPPGEPALRVDETRVDFGEVPVGGHVERRIFVLHGGGAPLNLSLRPDGPSLASSFGYALEASRLEAGRGTYLTVTFSHLVEGAHAGQLYVDTDHEGVAPIAISLSGTVVSTAVEVAPSSVDFGGVLRGETSTARVQLMGGSVARTLRLSEESDVGPCSEAPRSPFCVVLDGDSLRLEPDTSNPLDVRFTPSERADSRARLMFEGCGESRCLTAVELHGVGRFHMFDCVSGSHEMPATDPGATTIERLVCASQLGRPIRVRGWRMSGDSDPAFSSERSRAEVLAPGAALDLELRFSPTRLGLVNGGLELLTETATDTVSLFGTGGVARGRVQPERLSFGAVGVGMPARRRLTLTSTGTTDWNIGSPLFEGADAASFRVVVGLDGAPSPFGRPLSPGESAHLWVEVDAVASGTLDATLRLPSNGQDVLVALDGYARTLPECHYSLGPSPMALGPVPLTRAERRSAILTNVGGGPCLVTGHRWIDDAEGQVVLDETAPDGATLAPGESLVIPVRYTPRAIGEDSAELELSVSAYADRAFPSVRMSLEAVTDSQLLPSPLELRFGDVATGCQTPRRTLRIYNRGEAELELTAPVLEAGSAAAFSLVGAQGARLAPEGFVEVEVALDSSASGTYSGSIRLSGRVGSTELAATVPVMARVAPGAVTVENFRQGGARGDTADILLVTSGSGSTYPILQEVASGFGRVFEAASREGVDYQLGVTSTFTGASDIDGRLCAGPAPHGYSSPDGPAETRIIHPGILPDPLAVLRSNLDWPLYGGLREVRGILAVRRAVSPPRLQEHNAGLLRDGASLAVLVVSPERNDFYNPGSGTRGVGWAELRAAKGPGAMNRVTFSALVAPHPPGTCSSNLISADSAGDYSALVRQSGGLEASICVSDWTRLFQSLTPILLGTRDTFFLEGLPSSASLEVSVGGVSVPSRVASGALRWSYDLERNAVVFAPSALPEPGQTIQLSYSVICQ